MGQMLVRQIDDELLARLKARARSQRTSAEALAREAIHKAAQLSVSDKQALVARMLAQSDKLLVPGVEQTPGWVLIREDRDSR